MRVKSLTLENFRQFFGEQEVVFSDDINANVTIIHGENGSGKTALLNAFKWAFYGTTDFETGSGNLISERALAEANEGEELKLSVTVKFNHEDREYEAIRTEYFQKETGLKYKKIGTPTFELSWIDGKGVFQQSPNANTHINQILPERMHPYFFFNGERIEKLSNIESSPEIQRAIKGMMGIEIIERLGRHLSLYVIKDFKKALRNTSTDELANVIETETFYSGKVQESKDKIELYKSEKRHYRTILGDINNKLKKIGPIAELQKERERLTAEISTINEELDSIAKERLQCISRYGFLAISNKMVSEAKSILDEKRKKGELPARIKEQFLVDLMERNECICGRPLEEGSESYEHVKGYKKTAVPNDVESAFIETSSAVASMGSAKELFIENINNMRDRTSNIEKEKSIKHGRIDEISQQIGNSGVEDIDRLEEKREELREKLSEIDQKLGKWEMKLKENSDFLADWSKKRKELDKKGDAATVANSRLELAEEMNRVIDELHDTLSETVRNELSTIVNDTFKSIIKKEYWAEIDEEYTLQIKKKIGDHVQNVIDKSTGESQISSLSFIGGLVSLAKSRYGQSGEYYKGGIFPIVMDSPYGNLDPEYREKVADYLPNLAEQVIIMVSNSQWKNEVENAVKGRVGKEFTLIYHTPHKKEDTKTSSVIEGEKYEFSKVEEGYYE